MLLLLTLLVLPLAAQDVFLSRQEKVRPNDEAVTIQEYAKRYPDATTIANYQGLAITSASGPVVTGSRPTLVALKAGANPITITGHLIARTGYNNNKMGLYKFPATANPTLDSLSESFNFAGGASGFVKDGKYYSTRLLPTFGYNFVYASVFNLETGKFILTSQSATPATDCQSITTGNLVYDPTTDKVYGQFYETNYTLNNTFGTLNYNETGNWTHTAIAQLKNRYVAMGVDNTGQLYGIDINGQLRKIDKTDGTETFVGSTGHHSKH